MVIYELNHYWIQNVKKNSKYTVSFQKCQKKLLIIKYCQTEYQKMSKWMKTSKIHEMSKNVKKSHKTSINYQWTSKNVTNNWMSKNVNWKSKNVKWRIYISKNVKLFELDFFYNHNAFNSAPFQIRVPPNKRLPPLTPKNQ